MLKKPNVPVIAIEEHYSDPELYAVFTGRDSFAPPHVMKALEDTGEARLKDMDAAGIDIQVLSHTAPSLQKIATGAVALARRVNDRLNEAVIDAYYKEYAKDFPVLLRAAWGFTVETATLGVRLVLSGVFEKYQKLQFILGHLGEGLPFLLWRIDNGLARPGQKPVAFRDTFSKHFSITTSGFFADPALLLCVQEMGIDRILFAVDYPFEANAPGPAWLARVPLCDEDKAKIASGNARRLQRM